MQKEVETVEVLFDNVEYILIPSAFVREVKMGEVTDKLHMDGNKYPVTDEIALTIDKTFSDTEGLFMVGNRNGGISPDMHPLSRLLFFRDIVAVTLTFTDKTDKTIYGPWTDVEGYDYINTSQEAYLTPEGHVFVHLLSVEKNNPLEETA